MERLDEFSKLLAESVSRRQSLQRIGAALAGTVLSSLGVGTAWAARPDRCGAFCRWCSNKAQRNQCLAACRACNGNTSRLCGSCGAYTCCPTGKACCNGTCITVNSDPNNCGACGNICPASAPYCVQGACSGCPAGSAVCGGICTSLNSDPHNCGACGNVCPASAPYCVQGVCSGCPAGQVLCGGQCIGVQWNNANCGACGVVCPYDQNCVGGFCQYTEPPG